MWWHVVAALRLRLEEVALGGVTGANIADWMMRAGQEAANPASLGLFSSCLASCRGAAGPGWSANAAGTSAAELEHVGPRTDPTHIDSDVCALGLTSCRSTQALSTTTSAKALAEALPSGCTLAHFAHALPKVVSESSDRMRISYSEVLTWHAVSRIQGGMGMTDPNDPNACLRSKRSHTQRHPDALSSSNSLL